MTHDDFLQAMVERPADDNLHLVYADYLDEHGQANLAAFLRVQHQLTEVEDGLQRLELEARGKSLLAESDAWFQLFMNLFSRIPWLANLGIPLNDDCDVYWIRTWAHWPGPEEVEVRELASCYESSRDRVLAGAGAFRSECEHLLRKICRAVVDMATENVRLFDPKQDAWHGPTQCVRDVSHWAGLFALHVVLRVPMPPRLKQIWSWILAGHWPCGYRRGKLMVH
jgi:uncharacterized protein (TIGR02996 family)